MTSSPRTTATRSPARYELADSAWNGGKAGGTYKAEIARVLADAHKGEFSILIVWALDRITREGAEGALRLIRQLRERGCTLVSVQESWLNGGGDVQDILVVFAGWMAKQESDRRSERIRGGLDRRRAEGKPVGRARGATDRTPRRRSGYVASWDDGGNRRTAGSRSKDAASYCAFAGMASFCHRAGQMADIVGPLCGLGVSPALSVARAKLSGELTVRSRPNEGMY